MICRDCKYCEYVELDGYYCNKINAHICEEIANDDLDCMIYDCFGTYLGIIINDDGCKCVGVGLIPNISLNEL